MLIRSVSFKYLLDLSTYLYPSRFDVGLPPISPHERYQKGLHVSISKQNSVRFILWWKPGRHWEIRGIEGWRSLMHTRPQLYNILWKSFWKRCYDRILCISRDRPTWMFCYSSLNIILISCYGPTFYLNANDWELTVHSLTRVIPWIVTIF